MNPVAPAPGESAEPAVSARVARRRERRLHPRRRDLPGWQRTRPIRWLRRIVLKGLIFPLLRTGYSLRVTGREHATRVNGPVLLIANHNMHLDHALILRSLPGRFRSRLTIAASTETIYGNRVRGFVTSLIGNGFPFNKDGAGVRESLETVAQILDDGWHVLIFPEGKLTVMGPMQPFKNGTGYLAVETGAPVLPVRIDVHRPGFYEGRWFPTPRAVISIHIGPVVNVPEDTTYAGATALLEQAVREA